MIAGDTHPKVARSSTARPTARCSIDRAAGARGVAASVDFDAGYLDARRAGRADPVGRRRGAAVRLPRAGHLRRARRGGRGRAAGGRHRLPARGRAAGQRRRDRRAPAGPGGARRRAAPGADRAGAGRRRWPPRRAAWRRSSPGQRSPRGTPRSADGSARQRRASCRRDAPAADASPTSSAHRRFGMFEHADHAVPAPSTATASTTWLARSSSRSREPEPSPLVLGARPNVTRASSPTRRDATGGYPEPAAATRPLARTSRRRGLLGPERLGLRCAALVRRRLPGRRAPGRCSTMARRAALAVATGDGLRRARRRRGSRPCPRHDPARGSAGRRRRR